MAEPIDTEHIIQKARIAGQEVAAEIVTVHGLLWEGRENLAKLIVSLSSAIIVGTITFSGSLFGSKAATAIFPNLIIISWALLFFSVSAGLYSLWQANILKSFRIRFVNSEPDIEKEVSQLDPKLPPIELLEEIVIIVKRYSDASLNPLGCADKHANGSLNISLILFGLGLGVFLVYGSMQVT